MRPGRAGRRPLRRGVLRPRLRAALRQGLPVGALPLGVHRRLGRRQRRQGQHRARCRRRRSSSFEITLESFRLAVYSDNPDQQVRVVDLLDGRVVIDSTHPQDVDAPLGRPGRPQPALGADRARTACCAPATTCATWSATPARDSNVATTWAVVVSTPRGRVPGAGPFSAGPLGVAGPACSCSSCRWWATSGTAGRCTGPPGGTSSPACTTGARPASAPRRCWPASAAWR